MQFNIKDFSEGDEVDVIPGLVTSRAVVVEIITAPILLYVKEINGNFKEYIDLKWVIKHYPKKKPDIIRKAVQMSINF